ncbi:MAG: hypothetical protein KC493_17400, partial [Bacteriovoracaceae bacterium]|nr:hypothetical protein [Bacteriovoracaceae bacterium]
MHNLILISLFFYISDTNAKFASWVANIPCDKISLKVEKCTPKLISNKKNLKSNQLKNVNLILEMRGAMIKARVVRSEAMKCHEKQKMDLKLWKKPPKYKYNDFFVEGYKCSSKKDVIQVMKLKYFC